MEARLPVDSLTLVESLNIVINNKISIVFPIFVSFQIIACGSPPSRTFLQILQALTPPVYHAMLGIITMTMLIIMLTFSLLLEMVHSSWSALVSISRLPS